uniref:Uncharacterized protein n=1 Tax=Vespula pensylvanica TaxID=30213 RepID=A0A834NPX1_VESPE|nr:hypothetical protein H0235_011963 [Vespula pensylvanica]
MVDREKEQVVSRAVVVGDVGGGVSDGVGDKRETFCWYPRFDDMVKRCVNDGASDDGDGGVVGNGGGGNGGSGISISNSNSNGN